MNEREGNKKGLMTQMRKVLSGEKGKKQAGKERKER